MRSHRDLSWRRRRRSAVHSRTGRAKAITCCVIVGASLLVGNGSTVAAAPAASIGTARPSSTELARGVLREILGRPDQLAVQADVTQARGKVIEWAARRPDAVISASLVPTDGLTATAAADFLTRQGLDLISAEAKEPVGKSGEVYTMWFNDFERFGGSVTQKLERAVGKARVRHLQQAGAGPAAEQANQRELATGDIRLYRIDVAATASRLASLVNDPAIAAVLPDADGSKVTALQQRRATFGTTVRTTDTPVRLISGDPAKAGTTPGTPVLTNTGQRCNWTQTAGTLACQQTTWRPVSGDALIDSGLPRREGEFAAGGSSPASGGTVDSNAWTDCNVPSNSEGCPNDFTYSPRPQTSGTQNFAVLVNPYPAGTVVYYECYYVWVPGNGGSPNDGGYWQTYCYVYTITSAGFTYGAAAWLSVWGAQTTTVAPNVTLPVSTLAFKASGLTPCSVDPDRIFGTARCSSSDQNAIYVPSPGIEDELLIGNPACSGGNRNGDSSDWARGCFYPYYAESNLPGAYLDTTYGDHPAPDPWNLAVGSSRPAEIAEGATYINYAEFYSDGYNNMIGQFAWHNVSVDSWVTVSAPCAYGYAHGQPEAFCLFPVDSVRISERLPFV